MRNQVCTALFSWSFSLSSFRRGLNYVGIKKLTIKTPPEAQKKSLGRWLEGEA